MHILAIAKDNGREKKPTKGRANGYSKYSLVSLSQTLTTYIPEVRGRCNISPGVFSAAVHHWQLCVHSSSILVLLCSPDSVLLSCIGYVGDRKVTLFVYRSLQSKEMCQDRSDRRSHLETGKQWLGWPSGLWSLKEWVSVFTHVRRKVNCVLCDRTEYSPGLPTRSFQLSNRPLVGQQLSALLKLDVTIWPALVNEILSEVRQVISRQKFYEPVGNSVSPFLSAVVASRAPGEDHCHSLGPRVSVMGSRAHSSPVDRAWCEQGLVQNVQLYKMYIPYQGSCAEIKGETFQSWKGHGIKPDKANRGWGLRRNNWMWRLTGLRDLQEAFPWRKGSTEGLRRHDVEWGGGRVNSRTKASLLLAATASFFLENKPPSQIALSPSSKDPVQEV